MRSGCTLLVKLLVAVREHPWKS